jgi:serine/threonine protein kinase
MSPRDGDLEVLRKIRRLGGGTFGDTWLVERLASPWGDEAEGGKKLYAMKEPKVPPDYVGKPQEKRMLREVVHLLFMETLKLVLLESDHIVRVYGMEIFEDQHVMVMDFIDGQTLRDYMDEGRCPMEVPRALEIAVGIARGLATAHSHSKHVVHKDIKPQNVMIRASDGRAVIIDFGIGTLREQVRTGTRLMCTPPYASPEQLDPHQRSGAPADVYALASTLFEMVNGRRPFQRFEVDLVALYEAKCRLEVEPFREPVPEAIRQVILRGLDPNPGKRYRTGGEILEAISAFGGRPVPEEPERPADKHVSGEPERASRAGGDTACSTVARRAADYLKQANGHFLDHRLTDAVACLQEGLEIFPREAELHYRLGRYLHLCEDPDGAERALEEALRLWRSSGRDAGNRKQIQLAAWHLNQIREGRPGEPEPARNAVSGPAAPSDRLRRARELLERGQFQHARDELKRALGEQPDSGEIHYYLAVAYSSDFRPEDALCSLESAVRLGLPARLRRQAELKIRDLRRRVKTRGNRS